MFFEPGVLDAAHKQGIYLTDLNHDQKIDSADLKLAMAAKAKAAAAAAPAAKVAVATTGK